MIRAVIIGFRVGLFSFLICLVTWAGVGFAQGLKPEDFADGLLLEPEGTGPIYGLAVPETVYQGVLQKDLLDVAIFDAEGRMLSHAVRRPRNLLVRQEPVELPFFPLYESASEGKGEILFLFGTDSAGAILRRVKGPSFRETEERTKRTKRTQRTGREEGTQGTQRTGGQEGTGDVIGEDEIEGVESPKEKVLYAYLADASRLDGGIDALEIRWFGAGEAFISTVSVEGSDDLTRWRMLNQNATLADMNYRGHRLAEHRIPIPGGTGVKYLKILWPAGKEGVMISRISAIPSGLRQEPDRRWMRIAGQAVPAVPGKPGIYEYETSGLFPVDRLDLHFKEPNSLAQAEILSRENAETSWKLRSSGLFYRLNVGRIQNPESRLQSDPVRISATPDRYWRIVLSHPARDFEEIPELEIGYLPHEIAFIAQGRPPFRLAYGSRAADVGEAPLSLLLDALEKGGQAVSPAPVRIGGIVELGGEAALAPKPGPLPWRKWTLWAILIIGVAGAGFMAWRLYRMMETEKG